MKQLRSLAMAVAMAVALTLAGFATNLSVVWAQAQSTPRPATSVTTGSAAVTPSVTQAQACDPWNQPLNVAIPARQRVSVGRIVEIAAEDYTSAQVAQALMPARLPFPRLATRDRTSSGVSTVEALVNAVYAGSNEVVKAALIRETTSLIRRLGPNHVSLEETWLWCPVVDVSGAPSLDTVTGRPRRVSPTSDVCADGSLPRVGSRSRMLTNSFAGDFYAGSMVPWTNGHAPVDYNGWRGHSLRVNIKAGSAFSIPRVYGSENHPRPGAQLCRRLPQLVDEAATATSSTAKQAVLDEQAQLTTAAIAEGDLPTAMWATMLAATAVNPAVANLAVARDCERRESDLQGQLSTAKGRIDTLTSQRNAAIASGNGWRTIANVGYGLLLIAIVLFIIFVFRTRSAMARFTQSWEKRLRAAKDEAKNQFWNGLEFELNQMVSAVQGFLPPGESLAWALSFQKVPSIARESAGDPNGFFRNLRTAFAAALNARKASTPPALPPSGTQPAASSTPPPSTTPIKFVMVDGSEVWIKSQPDFDRVVRLIDTAAFQRGIDSVVIPTPSAPTFLDFEGMPVTIHNQAAFTAFEGKNFAAGAASRQQEVTDLTAARKEAEEHAAFLIELLVAARILDRDIGLVDDRKLARSALKFQINVAGNAIRSNKEEVRELVSARDGALKRAQAAEKDRDDAIKDLYGLIRFLGEQKLITADVVHMPFHESCGLIDTQISALVQAVSSERVFVACIWPAIFEGELPAHHVPGTADAAAALQVLRSRRVETGSVPAITIEEPGESGIVVGSSSAQVITNDPEQCMQMIGSKRTQAFRVPESLRHAAMPHRFATQLVAAAGVHHAPTSLHIAASPLPSEALGTGEAPAADPNVILTITKKAPTEGRRARRCSLRVAEMLPQSATPAEPVTPADFQSRRVTPLSSPMQAATPTPTDRPSFVGSPLVTDLRAPTPSGVQRRPVETDSSAPPAASDSTG